MEQKETQRGGQNRERLSRRLSSILKAPRQSMKVCGNDQDEKQEETKPIEKRRSSRRVSFATTNNIHVFPKDAKADPILAPIQNLTVAGVSDGQNDRMQCFDTHEIMGLDSMLTTPVHFALNKENFFPEPVLPFDTVDRTVLLGENTGYMDMTCSETIQIDMNDEYNPQLTLNMSSVGEPHKLVSQKAMPCKTFGFMEKDVMTSDFSGFLSSLPTAKAQNVAASFPKKNNNHFTLENTSNAKIDKENIPSTSSTRPLLLGRDHMTSSQTLIKEERGAFQRVPYSVGGNSMSANTWSSSNYFDDMELTQTVTKNFNGMENVNQSMSDGNRAKCKFVCDDSSEMIMTEVLDDYVQDQEQLSKQNKAGQFQSNVLFAPTVDSDDMEVTQSQTAVFETKYGRELFAQSSKAASGIGECKRNVTLATHNVFHSGHGKFVDPVLAGCTNVAVDMKHISTTKPQASFMLPKLGKMADLPLSRVVDDMEMTQCHTVHVDLEKTRQGVRDDLEKTCHTVCDDMEMTECQTVCDDLEKTRHTVCDSMEMTQCHTVCDDMEMTECQTVRVDLEKTRKALRDVTHNLQIPTHVTQCHTVRVDLEKPRQSVHDDMEMTGCHTARVDLEKPGQAVHDDMEMTGCHTVRADLEKPRQSVHDDMEMTGCHTVRVDLEKPRQAVHDDMEMTGCHTVRVDLEKPRQAVHDDMEMTGCHTVRVDLEKPRQSAHDDMEMTGCHTVRVDLEKPRQAAHDDMEMTGCHTVRADLEKPRQSVHDDMEMTGCHTVRVDLEKPRQAVHDDMEMTGCHTVAVDLEKTRHTVCNVMEMTKYPTVDGDRCDDHKSNKRLSLMSFRAKGMTHEHTGHMELDRYSFSKRTKTENRNILQGTASNTHFGEDLDLTGCRTINIDSKISPLNNMQSSLCVSSSSPTLDKMKRSERMVETPGTGCGSHVVDCNAPVSVTDLDPANLVDKHKRTIDQPVDTKNTSQKISEETDHPSTMTKTVSSARKEGYVLESDVDTLEMKAQSSAKSRRRSLADLQVKLQNMSQYIREQDGLLAGSVTAPLVSLTAVSPVENHSGRGRSSQPSEETPNEKQINLAQKGSTTPFNLKNSLMARLSVGGIMPKFPTRARSASPNQTEPISSNVHQKLQVQTLSSTDVQNDSYETDLIDEVLPEEDLSGTLFSYLSKNTEQEFPGVPLNEDATEHDQMKSDEVVNMSQSEEMATEVKDETTKDTSKKLWDSNYAAPAHMVKMIDDANFSSNSTMMKCDGISELTLRNSQLDSQMEGTMDDEFDFYKKLEEGSVTVNEFLTHFGAKFVIHRSRPSALPDNFGAAQTYTMEDLLREKYIHRPKQKVYETDCQKLSEMAEGFKAQMADQDKPLRSINGTLLQDMCAFSKDQLQRFGAKLKERRVYFRKRNKALSHKMKENLYSELLNTTTEAKQNLTSKIKEMNEMLKDLDGCINDLESELTSMNNIFMGDQHSLIRLEPVLKAKQEQLDALNSEVTVKETQICKLELQAQSLEDTWDKVQDDVRELKRCTTDLNSLNEWRFNPGDGNGVAFTFLHNTVQLAVKHKKATEKGQEGVEQEVDISVKFLLNAESSEPSAILIHKLLTENINSQAKWMQKYSTARDVPMLLHEFGVVVSRLRLLGEEIHRLKKWGGLRLGILHITCLDTSVEVMVSSVRAFVKFELSLAVPPDYPFRPLQLQKFQNHIGETRLEQIKDIISSVRPAKNYLTMVMKRIHSDLLR